jgi:cytochrome c556
MKSYAFGLVGGAALALGLCFLATTNRLRADDDDEKAIKEAQETILKIAQGKDGEGKKLAEELAKKADLGNVMRVFKPRSKGGIGVGPKGANDGIEFKIQALTKKELKSADLAKQGEDLAKMSEIAAAVGEVAHFFAPKTKMGNKDPKTWNQYVDEMKKASAELAKAAKAGDAPGVKTAANNLSSSCNQCHTDFRDN